MTAPADTLPTPPTEPATLASDPTLVGAGLTELDDRPATTNGLSHDIGTSPPTGMPEQASIDAGAANEVASSSWDREGADTMQASTTLSASGDGWVDVQASRGPAETDTGVSATPAAIPSSNSWAEEVAVEHATTATNGAGETVTSGDDGFHEVVRDHGRGGRGRGFRGERRGNRGDGNYRGRGRGDRDRGDRGDRGEGGHRGRGRGGGYRGRGRGGGSQDAGN
jgi:hypothetical protein